MRPPRPLLARTAPVLLALPLVGTGCTSDLPAPYNYDVLEPPPPDNELAIDCTTLPITAEGANYAQTPTITGQLEGVTYRHTATDLPAGLAIDERTGMISGTVAAPSGDYPFEVTIEDADDPENYSATATCTLQVRPRLIAPISLNINDTGMACLGAGDDLRSLIVEGTGDGSPITCDLPGGNGNGRRPNGIDASSEGCTLTGTIAEDRYGTWVFMMRGTQSGAEVFVPYCVTNDEAQGYEITARHSGSDDAALLPIAREYDPATDFSVGTDMDPRYEITSPGVCPNNSCQYHFSFFRTSAPIGRIENPMDPCDPTENGFCLRPSGLINDPMQPGVEGFYHGLYVSAPPVPEEFRERPWVLSVSVSYCFAPTDEECADVAADGDGALEFGLIMVPRSG